ncbi:MAG: MazG nucleotide pyrophosphohydrolase domain-containing protein [Bacillota bacterium]
MFPNEMKTIPDFQAFHRWMDEQKGWPENLLLNMVLLSGEVGEVANELKKIHWKASLLKAELGEEAAREAAKAEYREALGLELADCLAYIFKIANNAGIDLEQAYLTKMAKNVQRQWTAPPPPERKE